MDFDSFDSFFWLLRGRGEVFVDSLFDLSGKVFLSVFGKRSVFGRRSFHREKDSL